MSNNSHCTFTLITSNTDDSREYLLDKVVKAKGYNSVLIDFLATNDNEEFQTKLHESMINIDLNFPKMQEWINTEFDFS